MAAFDVAAALPQVRARTLVVSGSQDRLIPTALSRRTAELAPGAAFAVIDGGGHISSLDSAAAFTRLLLDFLAGVPAGSPP